MFANAKFWKKILCAIYLPNGEELHSISQVNLQVSEADVVGLLQNSETEVPASYGQCVVKGLWVVSYSDLKVKNLSHFRWNRA